MCRDVASQYGCVSAVRTTVKNIGRRGVTNIGRRGVTMSVEGYGELKEHLGHKIVCVARMPHTGEGEPEGVAIECETCKTVLFNFDRPHRHIVLRCESCHELYCPMCDDEDISNVLSQPPYECAVCIKKLKG